VSAGRPDQNWPGRRTTYLGGDMREITDSQIECDTKSLVKVVPTIKERRKGTARVTG
jgi:hypothetical protein